MTDHESLQTDGALQVLERRLRTTDDVYESLRAAILARRLAPGERLKVPSLAERLGVSRSPVREAVQKLVQQGLATEEAHRGAVVAVFDFASLIRLYELREVMEGLAARLACERATDNEVRELVSIMVAHEDALDHDDFRGHLDFDRRFHSLLRQAARNEHLTDALERLQDKVTIAMLAADISWPRHAVTEHRAILRAIESREAIRAQEEAAAHIARLRRDMVAAFEGARALSSVVDLVDDDE